MFTAPEKWRVELRAKTGHYRNRSFRKALRTLRNLHVHGPSVIHTSMRNKQVDIFPWYMYQVQHVAISNGMRFVMYCNCKQSENIYIDQATNSCRCRTKKQTLFLRILHPFAFKIEQNVGWKYKYNVTLHPSYILWGGGKGVGFSPLPPPYLPPPTPLSLPPFSERRALRARKISLPPLFSPLSLLPPLFSLLPPLFSLLPPLTSPLPPPHLPPPSYPVRPLFYAASESASCKIDETWSV